MRRRFAPPRRRAPRSAPIGWWERGREHELQQHDDRHLPGTILAGPVAHEEGGLAEKQPPDHNRRHGAPRHRERQARRVRDSVCRKGQFRQASASARTRVVVPAHPTLPCRTFARHSISDDSRSTLSFSLPRQEEVFSQVAAAATPFRVRRRLQLVLGRVAWPSVNPLLHQSELMMGAAGTNVTLHFSIHWTIAGKSFQLAVVC